MKFRNKILLAIWGVVLVLLLITSVIIRYWTEVQVEERSSADLRRNIRTVRELSALRSAEIMKSTEIVAGTPRMKAIVELGDRNTARQFADEMNRSLASDLFELSDNHGAQLVIQRDGKTFPADTSRRPVPNSGVDLRVVGNAVYRVAVVPLVIGTDRVGTLAMGFHVGRQEIADLHTMTNSELLLSAGDSVVVGSMSGEEIASLTSSLNGPPTEAFSAATADSAGENGIAVRHIRTRNESYLGVVVRLDTAGAVRLTMLRAIGKEVNAALKPVFSTFIILSVIVLLVTAVIGYFISQGITRPIGALIHGTAEISRGNYDYTIRVGADAEMRYLAERFQDMSGSLKDKMQQLADQNARLEQALNQLQEMQNELLRSERLAATGKMTAQLAHEINNPIHNIQSCLQTLLKRLQALPADSNERELLAVALEEVERLARLTRQMLDVYKTSFVPLELKSCSLNAIVEDAVAGASAILTEGRIDARVNLDPSLPPIKGSTDKLKQVFLNLFLNARDAMPNGGTLSVATRRDNGSVLVTVSDTGIGIPQENLNKVFEAFFTTKSAVSGVGLGLSVTYGIIRQHDGTISVRSAVGKGTTFSIVLPADQS